TPGTWHHIVADYHNDTTAHTVIHDALTIDGVRIPVNITHNAFFSGAANNQFTNAVQLDSNSTPAPYSIYVDGMKITYREARSSIRKQHAGLFVMQCHHRIHPGGAARGDVAGQYSHRAQDQRHDQERRRRIRIDSI